MAMGDAFLSDAAFDFPPYEGRPSMNYVIASTQRSGSTLLCNLLANMRVLGTPHEYFHLNTHGIPLIERFKIPAQPKLNLQMYFETVVRHRTSPNGVFGIKTHFHQWIGFVKFPFIRDHFRDLRVIRIKSRNVVAQAISLSMAFQTKQWTSQGSQQGTATYSFESITESLSIISKEDASWDRYLAVNQIVPFEICYEDLLDDPGTTVAGIGDFLGVAVDAPLDLESVGLSKQATPLNLAWEERYIAESRERDPSEPHSVPGNTKE